MDQVSSFTVARSEDDMRPAATTADEGGCDMVDSDRLSP